jgi:hypothetical protein
MTITYSNFCKSYWVELEGDVWNTCGLNCLRYWLDERGYKLDKDYYIQVYKHDIPVTSRFLFLEADIAMEFALVHG